MASTAKITKRILAIPTALAAAEAEHCGNQRNDQKHHRVMQHEDSFETSLVV